MHDVYKEHAAKIFNVPEEDVTAEQRKAAKVATIREMYQLPSKADQPPAFVLIKLPLGDSRAERAALRDAGLPVFIKGNTLCPDQESVYAIAADAMYSPAHREGILDMLAVLGVPHILHVDSDRQVTRCRKDNNYLPIGAPVIGTWEATGIPYSDGYTIRGRIFYIKGDGAQQVRCI